ncbi:MAG TPA: CHAT domain-containing protein [Chloroflexia bacterium]|nr:CHAT domain-containing protein [Chloroflexia bacterium]
MHHLDFDVEIVALGGSNYQVTARSPAGEASERLAFPFDEPTLASKLKDLQIALLRSGGGRRRVSTGEEQTVEHFGRDLFNVLLAGEVRNRYDVSRQRAAEQGGGLRLRLRIKAPELAVLPWEFLYDPRQAEYLSLSRHTPIVRYLDVAQLPGVLKVTPPLQLLGMVASPSDQEPLDIAHEQARIEEALQNLRAQGLVEITWLAGQTWRDLQRAMRGGPWHLFHFIGHGGFDPHADEGLLALASDTGGSHLLTATNVARLLADHQPLRMVLLNACEGGRASTQDIFSSTAATLVRRGIPAVLAMQYEISDRAAVEFARVFYEALVDGLPVDEATTEARIAVSLALDHSVEWGTPVLHMRSPDGILLQVEGGIRARISSTDHPASREREPANVVVAVLDKDQRKTFHQALLAAFPTYNDLAQMVNFELDENLEAITDSRDLRQAGFRLISWAQAHGKLADLIAAALAANPDNPQLQAFRQYIPGAGSPADGSPILAEGQPISGEHAARREANRVLRTLPDAVAGVETPSTPSSPPPAKPPAAPVSTPPQPPDLGARRQQLAALLAQTRTAAESFGLAGWVTTLDDWQHHLDTEEANALFVSEFKRGQSTLINALLGQEILPTAVSPAAALLTEIKWGREPRARLYPTPGTDGDSMPVMEIQVTQVGRYLTMQQNTLDAFTAAPPYERLEIYWPVPFCENGVHVIDTPGWPDYASGQDRIMRYVPYTDAIVIVFRADMALSMAELDLIAQIHELTGKEVLFFVGNAYDNVSPEDREALQQHCRTKLAPYISPDQPRLFFVSAREALRGQRSGDTAQVKVSGVPALAEALLAFLHNRLDAKFITKARALHESLIDGRTKIDSQIASLHLHQEVEIHERQQKIQAQLALLEDQLPQFARWTAALRSKLQSAFNRHFNKFADDMALKIPDWLTHYELQHPITRETLLSSHAPHVAAVEVTNYIQIKVRREWDERQQAIIQEVLELSNQKLDIDTRPILSTILTRILLPVDRLSLFVPPIVVNRLTNPILGKGHLFNPTRKNELIKKEVGKACVEVLQSQQWIEQISSEASSQVIDTLHSQKEEILAAKLGINLAQVAVERRQLTARKAEIENTLERLARQQAEIDALDAAVAAFLANSDGERNYAPIESTKG